MTTENVLISTLAACAIVLSPIYGLIIVISLAVGIDTIYAIYYTVKTKGWEGVDSHKAFNIVPKTALYMSSIIFAFLIDTFFFEGKINGVAFAIAKIVSAVWTSIELKSIDETRTKLGHKSMFLLIKETVKSVKEFKKDINE
jgi:hypothetical protein